MATRSQKIDLHTSDKIHMVNKDNLALMERYKVDMAIRELSEGTQYAYVQGLKQWFVYVMEHQDNRSVLTMTDDDITQFLYWCKQYGNNTCRMKLRISIISSFFRFLRKKKLLTGNPTEFIEPPKRTSPVVIQTFLTSEQVALMREKLIEYGDLQLRLYATISLSTMARIAAIASLKWSQVDFNSCVIRDVLEKEGKIVEIYFNDETKLLLQNLKKERRQKNIDDHGWLFYTVKCTETRHIHKNTLYEWCKRIGKLIGVESLHPHDFRHSGATLLRNAGMALEDISVLLNHESTETTQKFYVKCDTRRINEMKNRLNY